VIDDPETITGDIILVHDGTYKEDINFNGKAIIVSSENGRDAIWLEKERRILLLNNRKQYHSPPLSINAIIISYFPGCS